MDMPMRTYSSGMYGRLAFSVAVNMDPDILLIDEALSVGDARFKPIVAANPLYPMLTSLSDVVNLGEAPSAGMLAWGAGWAIAAFVIGALFFISREREFAVRL